MDADDPRADDSSAGPPAVTADRTTDSVPDGAAGPVVDFYWRPGCGFCSMLRRRLQRRGIQLREHNIWEDDDAATVVRAAAGGNETVPTVGHGGLFLVNPGADEVERLIAAQGSDARTGR